jgi:hypothetical protein
MLYRFNNLNEMKLITHRNHWNCNILTFRNSGKLLYVQYVHILEHPTRYCFKET